MSSRGAATSWSLLLVVVIVAGAMLWAMWPEGENFEQATGLDDVEAWQSFKQRFSDEATQLEESVLSSFERGQIEAWIVEEDLNEYGDPEGTMYTGGTPLFNEATGETTDRFEYIIQNHPDKPWKN